MDGASPAGVQPVVSDGCVGDPMTPKFFRLAVSEFRIQAFAGRPPSALTIRRMIERRELPGEKLGGKWFVHVDESGQPVKSTQSSQARSTGNAAADQLLTQWLSASGAVGGT